MNAPTLIRPPCVRPSDCWDWLGAEDVIRHALAAYYAASRAMDAPPGEPFVIDGSGYADRRCFRDELLIEFAQRVNVHALGSGVGRPVSGGADLPPGRSWDELGPDPSLGAEEPSGVAGAEPPSVKGHGCPALAVAAGDRGGAGSAAQRPPEAGDAGPVQKIGEAPPDDPLLFGQQGKELPSQKITPIIAPAGALEIIR